MTVEIAETAQYLDFKLGDEVFAIDVGKIREILDLATITKVPHMPPYMRGVINLRGSVVSVIDMRMKFGMPIMDATVDTCIVVVEVSLDGETTVLGALVDSVQEVFELSADDIEPAPRIGTRVKADFIDGMGKKDDSFVIILNVDHVFSGEDVALAEGMVQAIAEQQAEVESEKKSKKKES